VSTSRIIFESRSLLLPLIVLRTTSGVSPASFFAKGLTSIRQIVLLLSIKTSFFLFYHRKYLTMTHQTTNTRKKRFPLTEDQLLRKESESVGSHDIDTSEKVSTRYTGCDEGSLSNEANGSRGDEKSHIKKQLGSQQTNKVATLRYIVIGALVFSAAAVCTGTYILARQAELKSFMTSYDGASAKIVTSFESLQIKLGLVNMIGIAATTYGSVHNKVNDTASSSSTTKKATQWPFITISNFHQTASTIRSLAGVLYVSISPLVSENDRREWEEYVVIPDSTRWM
jgi:hypothetical protein